MTESSTSTTATGRIVLLGATGYTGALVAHELVALGARPVLAGRSQDRLDALAADLDAATGISDGTDDTDHTGGSRRPRLETALADVDDPRSVRALVERGDVLVSTVGPFVRHGAPAVETAVDAGAVYLDSTGEPAFIRRVFDELGPRAERTGAALLTAFGHDWVPGNVAGAVALQDEGAAAARVDIGYFPQGATTSGGTRASGLATVLEPSYAWRDGRLRSERVAARVVTFELGPGRRVRGITSGGTEPFALPGLAPGLQDVEVVLGLSGRAVPLAPVATAVVSAALRVPGIGTGLRHLARARSSGSTGGPDAATRATSRTRVLADARSPSGELLRRVRLDGPDPYDLTARFLAWGATSAAAGGVRGTGALGPVQAFGLDDLLAASRDAGATVTVVR
ncbi:saccharopine dehydrogenase family protein [Cellulosimicrobium arenosum]|uniref:Saccharopine dehydrogenase NADP-binding domain-containing protein n=1 Tax=Cellulosimicrobium arenosum TaxID=2708133 RepID=A0A927G833_9MICO|nr:saccharopine dehydrogenase NADP-binding domain-containing protein [Cellulosimicrobium arenosum]MBD8078644.1 saccharopine dehydrogenase NADP-binding domain-containing protein [Cellulosimicrobium arenosum]